MAAAGSDNSDRAMAAFRCIAEGLGAILTNSPLGRLGAATLTGIVYLLALTEITYEIKKKFAVSYLVFQKSNLPHCSSFSELYDSIDVPSFCNEFECSP